MPRGPVGSVTLGGIPFNIKSNSASNEAWNAWMNRLAGQTNLAIPVSIYGVTNVYTLISTYWAASSGSQDAFLIFTGGGGASYVKPLVSGSDIRGWTGGTINGKTTVNVYSASGSPINGHNEYLDMQSIALPAAFADQVLISIELVDNGASGVQRVILDGATVQFAVQSASGAAIASIGFSPVLTISGAPGETTHIQRTENIGHTNSWLTITNLTLAQPSQSWVDTNVNVLAPFNPQYFYRIVP